MSGGDDGGGIRPDASVRTIAEMPPVRLERGAVLGIHAPEDQGGEQIAGARLHWLTGEPIEVWSKTAIGNVLIRELCDDVRRRWRRWRRDDGETRR